MVWKLALGNFGMCGDSYTLISTFVLSEHETREDAWEAFFADNENSPFDLLVIKPDFSPCAAGWPTDKDDPIDYARWVRHLSDYELVNRPFAKG